MTVRHGGPVPVYRQIAGFIAERIESGELEPHDRIPSEQELIETYDVARATAREAIRLLREQGWVYTVSGRGSYVSERDQG